MARVVAAAAALPLLLLLTPLGARAQGAAEPPLARTVALRLDSVPLATALRRLADAAGVRLSFSRDLIPADRPVSLAPRPMTVSQALAALLDGTGVAAAAAPGGLVVLQRAPPPAPNAGATAGGARDSAAARPRPRAPVVLAPVRVNARAGEPGEGALPPPAVVAGEQIAARRLARLGDALAGAVPGVVAWDFGPASVATRFAGLRGAATLSSSHTAPKTYVDGVELASPVYLTAVDPGSVERMEVTRGPHGSALHGAGAGSGVLHIVTERGRGAARPRVEAYARTSAVRGQMAPAGGPLAWTREHALAAHGDWFGRGVQVAASGGGSLFRVGEYAPNAYARGAATWGGARLGAGAFTADLSLRQGARHAAAPSHPVMVELCYGRVSCASPPQHVRQRTTGVTLHHAPSTWWEQTLTVGYDGVTLDIVPEVAPFFAPVDSALAHERGTLARRSARYSGVLRPAALGPLRPTVTVGAELSRLRHSSMAPRMPFGLNAPDVRESSRGYFAQLALAAAGRLHLSAGLRAETSADLGDGHGTSWLPALGAAYVRAVGPVTTRAHVAYGRGVRRPPPGAAAQQVSEQVVRLANPLLGPETQEGVEGGIALHAGSRFSVQATRFAETAEGLVQLVAVSPTTQPVTLQAQNLGVVENEGWELQGTLRAAPLSLTAAYATTSSRVRRLAPRYYGDLRVGDEVPEIPRAVASAIASYEGARTRASVAFLMAGPWVGYDQLRIAQAVIDSRERSVCVCAPPRSFWRNYPRATRSYATVSRALGARLSAELQVDNLTGGRRVERDNSRLVMGRTLSAGARLAY